MHIEWVDHMDESVRRALLDFLAPHEPHALFLAGNLANRLAGARYAVATDGGRWRGVVGYFAPFHSVSAWADAPDVAAALVRHAAVAHGAVEYVNVTGALGGACRAAMRELGYREANDPEQVFMEADLSAGLPPPQPHEAACRAATTADGPAVARVTRHLTIGGDDGSAPTPDELRRATLSPHRFVLVADGQVVSTAMSNGVGLAAFQILGVATAPAHRGRGYARAACAALIRSMHARGGRHCVLFTARDNAAAQACYAKLGFRATGTYCMAKYDAA